ncbi:DUF6625 family protein [Peribacillus simplex]|uniref:DUF6625 family protein n=1 Tax=Peribacillus simplex TaxID=1478 RepID=UPI003D2AE185
MNKIGITGVYFGEFPTYFPLWLNSCSYNETIDFIIISDQNIPKKPDNVRIIKMTFNEFKNMAQRKLELEISVERPYKICDFKPAIGVICEDYLTGYDFWGYCDFDMIFGDLRKYFTDELLGSYDKILPLGHLSLYRNTKENNNRYKLDGSLVGDYKKVFTTDKGFAFDELNGIYQIYKSNHFSMYDERIFADISSIHKRFRLALNDVNYKYQIFSFHEGKIYREYFINNTYYKEEFIYIHIKKPKSLDIKFDSEFCSSFYVTNTGFYKKEKDAQLNDVKKYNNYLGDLFEKNEKIKSKIIYYSKALQNKILTVRKNMIG